MYERLLNKDITPDASQIAAHIGKQGGILLNKLEKSLNEKYDIVRELKFPFGNSYDWGFKYSHKNKYLCYVFFEKNAITVTVSIGNGEVSKLNGQLNGFLPKTKKLWDERYPCGKGGWVNYRALTDNELTDILKLIEIKKKPVKKR
ncbi:MAG: DUF3788 domain-containing protein [Endomicrobium sp.]|jgi:hypothetical protein|nr:DUF3788 domain-containing protein [Endomicrobium sp.]